MALNSVMQLRCGGKGCGAASELISSFPLDALHSNFSLISFSKNRVQKGRYRVNCSSKETRTPHSGYHFDGSSRRFFEGWYFKVSIPEIRQSFAWMYSIEDPATKNASSSSSPSPSPSSNPLDISSYGRRFPGVGAQIMGANDEYLFQFDNNVNYFWASSDELSLGHVFRPHPNSIIPNKEISSMEFKESVREGFQASATWHQGYLVDNEQSPNLNTVQSAEWAYSTRPIYGWGNQGEAQKATAGWLAALPVFEPHWQICQAGGLASGFVRWGNSTFEFIDSPSYVEKNWGGSFPQKWFWVQCNVFDDVKGEVALTAGGGRRGNPLLPGAYEEVAMIGIHYDGKFFEFVPWNGIVEWEIKPWGMWKMKAKSPHYEVELLATTESDGVVLRAPTADNGLFPMCKDTFFGQLSVTIWHRTTNGDRGKLLLKTQSDMAALEIGGGPWWTTWRNFSEISGVQASLFGLPLDVASVLEPFPVQLPGL